MVASVHSYMRRIVSFLFIKGAVAQVVRPDPWILIAEDWVTFRVISHGTCGGQSRTGELVPSRPSFLSW